MRYCCPCVFVCACVCVCVLVALMAHECAMRAWQVDAASRVVDPVFTGVDGRRKDPTFTPLHGIFLKDFQETEW